MNTVCPDVEDNITDRASWSNVLYGTSDSNPRVTGEMQKSDR